MTPASWHTNMMSSMKRKTDAELRFIRRDAVEASICAYGLGNPVKAGRYADEAHYANMELFRRLQLAQHEESVKQAQQAQVDA
jgi:hypothetical protein